MLGRRPRCSRDALDAVGLGACQGLPIACLGHRQPLVPDLVPEPCVSRGTARRILLQDGPDLLLAWIGMYDPETRTAVKAATQLVVVSFCFAVVSFCVAVVSFCVAVVSFCVTVVFFDVTTGSVRSPLAHPMTVSCTFR